MKDSFLLIIILFFVHSCTKIDGNSLKKFEGKYKLENGVYLLNDGSPSLTSWEEDAPFKYENCYIEIQSKKIVFTNNGTPLKLPIIKVENKVYDDPVSNSLPSVVITTRELNGQKRVLQFYFKDGFLRGHFYSKGGYISSKEWYEHTNYINHKFTKL